MNINQIDDTQLLDAKTRARGNAVNFKAGDVSMLERARYALLSYSQSYDDWDEICAWFDELARREQK